MIRIGIVGTGYTIGIAQDHVKAYQRIPDVKIVALYDIIPGRAKRWARENKLVDVMICESYDELLKKVDAVSICTPNYVHVEQTVQAIKAGKHVLCEKPISTNLESCQEAIKYAKSSVVIDMVGFCYRGIPGIQYIKKLIDENQLGKIFYLKQTLGGNRIADPNVKLEWRMQEELAGGGAIADFGSHVLDIADYLLRDVAGSITEVSCVAETFMIERDEMEIPGKGIVTNDDCAMFIGKTQNNTMVSGILSRIGGEHTLELASEGGYIKFNGERPFEIEFARKDKVAGYSSGLEVIQIPKELYKTDENTPEVKFEINFYEQIKAFTDAIKSGKKLDRNLERGAYIQYLIEQLRLSAETGRKIKLQ